MIRVRWYDERGGLIDTAEVSTAGDKIAIPLDAQYCLCEAVSPDPPGDPEFPCRLCEENWPIRCVSHAR